jgi:hypothetical protein
MFAIQMALIRTGETARLREQGPNIRAEMQDGVLAWSVHGYHAGEQVMSGERFPGTSGVTEPATPGCASCSCRRSPGRPA